MSDFKFSDLPKGERTLGEIFETEGGQQFIYLEEGWTRIDYLDIAKEIDMIQKSLLKIEKAALGYDKKYK